ncbi:MAG: hypothetical protein WAU91_07345, partial [Desulfatitalea sp.]
MKYKPRSAGGRRAPADRKETTILSGEIMFRKLSIAFAAILLLATIGLTGAYYYYVRRPLPQTQGALQV